MVLNIVYSDRSVQVVNLSDKYEWNHRDSRRQSNVFCLAYDISLGKGGHMVEYNLVSKGKLIDKQEWKA
jgi:hypothetical protein